MAGLSDADPLPGELDPPDMLDSRQAGGLIVRGGALRLGTYVATIGLSVLSVGLLTRHLQPVLFGEYTTVLSLVAVFASVTDAGMSTIGTREFAVRKGADRDAFMSDLLGLRMLLTMVGVVLVLIFALAAGYDTSLLVGAALASLGTVALVVQHTHTIPLSVDLRLGALSALELARQILTVAAIVVLVVLGAGVLPLLAVALAVNLVMIPPTAALAGNRISLRMRFSPQRWTTLLRLTVAFSLATAVGTVYIYTAQILTSLVADSYQSGQFAASFRIFIAAAAVPGLLVGGALPLLARAARDDRERLSYALQRIFEVSLILGIGAAVAVFAGARFIIHVIAGPHYAGAVVPLKILAIGMIASFLLAGWSFALLSLQRYRGLLLANLGALVVSCALTAILATTHGATGAAVASLCGEATLAVGLLVVLTRGHPELAPRLSVAPKVALATAVAFALAALVPVSSLASAIIAFAAYSAVIALTHALPGELIDILPPALRRRLGTDGGQSAR